MTVNEIIKKRRSIRNYKQGAVSTEQLKTLLEAAMLAPSAVNSRPWEFIVIRNREILDSIANIPNTHYSMLKTSNAAIIVCADMKSNYKDFFPQDCGAATQNILLQATELDLGTCWCGIYPKEDIVKIFKEMFSLSENIIPFCVIALGIPDEEFGSHGFYEENKVTWID